MFSSTSEDIFIGPPLWVLFFALAVFISGMDYFIHTDQILHSLSEYCCPSVISFDMICLSCE